MTERKGDLARRVLSGLLNVGPEANPELEATMDALVTLAQHDALAGVAELISERLDQIMHHEYSVAHDAARWENGWLVMAALLRITRTYSDILEGGGDYSDAEEACREAGALLAAEIDRLDVLLSAAETEDILSDPATVDAIREGSAS